MSVAIVTIIGGAFLIGQSFWKANGDPERLRRMLTADAIILLVWFILVLAGAFAQP